MYVHVAIRVRVYIDNELYTHRSRFLLTCTPTVHETVEAPIYSRRDADRIRERDRIVAIPREEEMCKYPYFA